MILVTTAYPEPSELRQAELKEALLRNMRSQLFERIIVCVEGKPEYLKGVRSISIVAIATRPTYEVLFRQGVVGKVMVVANADIFFDETIKALEKYDLSGKFLAISRHYVDRRGQPSLLHGHPHQSQDAWIYKAPLLKFKCDIPIGFPGCDHRIAYEAAIAGLQVCNPCRSISIFHLHNSRIRHYTKRNRLSGAYAQVAPCFLEEIYK